MANVPKSGSSLRARVKSKHRYCPNGANNCTASASGVGGSSHGNQGNDGDNVLSNGIDKDKNENEVYKKGYDLLSIVRDANDKSNYVQNGGRYIQNGGQTRDRKRHPRHNQHVLNRHSQRPSNDGPSLSDHNRNTVNSVVRHKQRLKDWEIRRKLVEMRAQQWMFSGYCGCRDMGNLRMCYKC